MEASSDRLLMHRCFLLAVTRLSLWILLKFILKIELIHKTLKNTTPFLHSQTSVIKLKNIYIYKRQERSVHIRTYTCANTWLNLEKKCIYFVSWKHFPENIVKLGWLIFLTIYIDIVVTEFGRLKGSRRHLLVTFLMASVLSMTIEMGTINN